MTSNVETSIVQRVVVGLREFQKATGIDVINTSQARAISHPQEAVDGLLELLKTDWFVSMVGYFINHRSGSAYAKLDDEYKVQDLIYGLALTVIPDLQYEDPQKKNVGAVASTRVDFYSAECQLFLEIKLASSAHTAKKVEAEISEDIVKYGKQKIFSTLIFFVYCYDYAFPGPRQFEKGHTGAYSIDGHHFQTHCVVKP